MSETCIRFGKHGARVIIEDKEIRHHAINVDQDKKEISCWIASEAGKAFSVEWFKLDVEYPTLGRLYLDGHSAVYKRRQSHDTKPCTFRYAIFSESSRVPFLFSALDVTDDDTYLDSSPSQSIGEIKLVIVRTTVHKAVENKCTYLTPLPHLQKVHERSKKAIAHRVNYGSEIPRRTRTHYTSETLETLVTLIFKYQPLDILRANDIAPRNPELLKAALDTPSTSETSSRNVEHSKVKKEAESGSEIDDDNSIRERALLAEVQRCQAEVERIRKGRQLKDGERPKKKLKKEHDLKPLFIPGEIIDLT